MIEKVRRDCSNFPFDEWDDLIDRAGIKGPFLKKSWIISFCECAGMMAAEPMILLVRHQIDNQLMGCAPLYISRNRFGISRLRMIPDFISADYLDIIAVPEFREKCLKELFIYLRRDITPSFKYIIISGLLIEAVKNIRYESSSLWYCSMRESYTSPYVELPDIFDQFIQSRSSSQRYYLRRKERAFTKAFPQHVFEIVDLSKKYGDYANLVSMHVERWKEQSTFSNAFKQTFFYRLLNNLTKDEAYISTIRIKEVVIASSLIFSHDKNWYFYQIGWLPAYEKYSPGIVLIQNLIRSAIARKCCKFDFLRGEEEYKFLFASRRKTTYELTLLPRTNIGLLLHLWQILEKALKRNLISKQIKKYIQNGRRPIKQPVNSSTEAKATNRSENQHTRFP